MASSERRDEPTPRGGVYSIIYFQDADGNPVEQPADVVKAEVIEYDAQDNEIFRTYLNKETGTLPASEFETASEDSFLNR